MKFSFIKTPTMTSETVIVPIFQDNEFSSQASDLNQITNGNLSKATKSNHFKGKQGALLEILAPSTLECDRLLLLGMGKKQELTQKDFQDLGGKIYAYLSRTPDESVEINMTGIMGKNLSGAQAVAHMAYGALLRSWRFDKYRTKENDETIPSLATAIIVTDEPEEAEELFKSLAFVAEGIFLTRELVSEPPNVLYPESYAEKVTELKNLGLEIDVLTEKQMQKLGMNALLGVGQGSFRDSYLVTLQWNGADDSDEAPLAFVGKGVCFDSGGISLKPANGMEDMKYDMGGSAVVVGLMKALASRKANVNAVGVIGLVENMPDGNAQRPSDIVTSMSGQTIEVLNTDAEGRLVLADALWYTQDKFKPKLMIDLATLTGAIIVALGSEYAGLFSNNDEISERLTLCGEETGEKVWRFPLHSNYDKSMDSDVADVQNISKEKGAGSITAAQFLQRFINNTPWAHLDIAGVAWTRKSLPTCEKGATGFGVRLLDTFVRRYYEA